MINIALEGNDAVGKTTLLREFSRARRTVGPSLALEEFSTGPVGQLLGQSVESGGFIGGSRRSVSPFLGIGLVLADMGSTLTDIPKGDRGLVLKDRWTLSLGGCQAADLVLANGWSVEQAVGYCWAIACALPQADLTVMLTTPEDVRSARLAARGEVLTADDYAYLRLRDDCYSRAANVWVEGGARVHILSGTLPRRELVRTVYDLWSEAGGEDFGSR